MHRLNIPVRKNIYKDDTLKVTIFEGRMMTCSYGQDSVKPFYKFRGLDTNNRWYIHPKIAMSSILDSIYSRKRDTSRFIYIKALGSVVHELTHYLQNEWVSDQDYINLSLENPKSHFLQPVEFQAYSVEGYYDLNFANKKELKRIMNSKKYSIEEKQKMLAVSHFRLEYPRLLDEIKLFETEDK